MSNETLKAADGATDRVEVVAESSDEARPRTTIRRPEECEYGQDVLGTLLRWVDHVAANSEHQAPTSSLPSAALGLGITALAFSERWRPKRTERIKLERNDAVQTAMVCELDIDEAVAICTSTQIGGETWLPLFRLRPGTSAPGYVTDERGAQLPVMSVEEVAGHVAAGVAQVLLSDVLRSAIVLPNGDGWGSDRPQATRAHRRSSQISYLLVRAIQAMLFDAWATPDDERSGSDDGVRNETQSFRGNRQPVLGQIPAWDPESLTCGDCAGYQPIDGRTRREFGASRVALHHAAHSWVSDSWNRMQGLALRGHGGAKQTLGQPIAHRTLETGLSTLVSLLGGSMVVALAPKNHGRTTLEAHLAPRALAIERPNSVGDRLRQLRRGPKVQGHIAIDLDVTGTRLNRAVAIEAKTEAGVDLTPASGVSVELMGSRPQEDRPLLADLVDGPATEAVISGPHPVPELQLAIENLQDVLDASPHDPHPAGARACANRIGAHATQVARLLESTRRLTYSERQVHGVEPGKPLRSETATRDLADRVASSARKIVEESGSPDGGPSGSVGDSTLVTTLKRLVSDCHPLLAQLQELGPRHMDFIDRDEDSGVFRAEIGALDIPDRFIRPLKASAHLVLRLEPGLRRALRWRVGLTMLAVALLVSVAAVVTWVSSPSADALASVLLLVPAVLVVLQRLERAPTLRVELESSYNVWLVISLISPALGAIVATTVDGKQPGSFTIGVGVLAGLAVVSFALALTAWAHLTRFLDRRDEAFPAHDERAKSSFELASYEPDTPRLDQLRLIGRTAADAAARADSGNTGYALGRMSNRIGAAAPTDAGGWLCASKAFTPSSVFLVRLGNRFFEFVAGAAGNPIPTKEQVRQHFERRQGSDRLIVRSLKSASDGPVFGAGQLSETWVEWHDESDQNEAAVVESASGLAAAFQSPLSYFHLRSWENGHLFTRVGTYLSQRGRRDEVAYEGHLLRSLASPTVINLTDAGAGAAPGNEDRRSTRPDASGYSVSFVPPAFAASERTGSEQSDGGDDVWGAGPVTSYWDIALVARALIGSTQSVFRSFAAKDAPARIVDGSMTVLDGTVALAVTLQVRHDPGSDPHHLELPDEVIALIETPFCVDGRHDRDRTLQYRQVDRSHVVDACESDPRRSSLWVSWRGLATAADPSWIGSALQTWENEVMAHAESHKQIGELQVDYLVSRVRRGREQVGRARVSFMSPEGGVVEATFSTWERTIQKVLEAHVERHGNGERIPATAKVTVQRLEPRSRRFRDGGGA